MTDGRDERDRERRERKHAEEADEVRREHEEQRSDELKKSWRRNHPSEQEEERKDQPKRGASGMTERDQSTTRRDAAERSWRELEIAGWEPKGMGAKTIWQSPADGRWYAHYQAVEMMKAEISPEEKHLLGEHGFERTAATDRERWSRREEAALQLYTRSQALTKARREAAS